MSNLVEFGATKTTQWANPPTAKASLGGICLCQHFRGFLLSILVILGTSKLQVMKKMFPSASTQKVDHASFGIRSKCMNQKGFFPSTQRTVPKMLKNSISPIVWGFSLMDCLAVGLIMIWLMIEGSQLSSVVRRGIHTGVKCRFLGHFVLQIKVPYTNRILVEIHHKLIV